MITNLTRNLGEYDFELGPELVSAIGRSVEIVCGFVKLMQVALWD